MTINKTLDNSLLLRSAATSEDIAKIEALVERYLGDGEWVRALTDGTHTSTGIADFTLVEDTTTGQVVSTMCFIPQTWSYGGIPFGVARMDLVATEESYRWRGLLRAQFEALHEESAARGHMLQVVVGRPWLYRKFGYEMALPYGQGTEVSRRGVQPLAEGQNEPFVVRPGTEADLPYWAGLFLRDQSRFLVACQRSEVNWRHDFYQRGGEAATDTRLRFGIIEDARPGLPTTGKVVGGMVHAASVDDGLLYVFSLALEPGLPWLEAGPSVLRYLVQEGERYAQRDNGRLDGFWFGGLDHPVLAALTDHMQRVPPEGPYAWYVRLADPAGFLLHVAPVINQRIAQSVIAGWSGQLKLNFYERETSGLTISIENGCLVGAQNGPARGGAAMPVEHFKRILFGYRSVAEIEAECAEVALDGRSRAILNAMFPKAVSRIFSLY